MAEPHRSAQRCSTLTSNVSDRKEGACFGANPWGMEFDAVIVGGRVIDGSGNAWKRADIGVVGDSIAAIAPPGALSGADAARRIDASGKVVAPGFIDIQSHSLIPFLTDGRALSKVTQGVTTEILGELWTPAPNGGRRTAPTSAPGSDPSLADEMKSWKRFADWIGVYEKRGVSVNVGSFVGGATVREYACGWDAAPATPEQIAVMERITGECMDDGAFGIAPALIYPPDSYSTDEQLTACARVVGRHGGVYIVHLRSEGDEFLEALEQTAKLSVDANCPVEIYHLKASGERNWPKIPDAIAAIDRYRASGTDITADMYPYVGSGTGLSVLIPLWASEGGRLFQNLADPSTRARIHDEMFAPGAATGDFAASSRGETVMPLGFMKPENRRFIGKRLTEIASEMGMDWADAAIELLISEGQRIFCVFFSMHEDNVKLQLEQPWIKISTDAGGVDPASLTSPIHPRAFGTYTRVLGKYVRDEKVLSLEDAVRKMSGAVADRLGMKRRGRLLEGHHADIVVFDPGTVSDRATFTDPHQLSVGIEHVLVNGVAVVSDGVHTGSLPGRTVRRGD